MPASAQPSRIQEIISGVLHSSRKRYKANVLELVFQSEAQRIVKTNIIRRTVLNHLRCVSNEHRDNICMSWFRNSNVAKQVRDAFVDYQCTNNRDAEIIRSMMRLFRVEKTELVVNAQESFLKAMHWLGSKKHELIVKLVRQQGELVVKEVRGPDFSVIKKYYIVNPPDPECPWQEGVLPIVGNWTKLGCNSEGYYVFGWKFTNLNRANILEIGVNTEKPVVRVNSSDIVRRLYNAVADSPGGAIEEMKNTYDMLGKQLAEAGDDVFIYELLQNANDYPHDDTVDVEIRIEDDCLTFSHTGETFTAGNVAAICTINYRDKSDNPNVIGYKGIGFKTVFRFNNKVIIRSGEFNFSFDEREEKIHDLPWMKTPVLEPTNGILPLDYRVVIKLFPRDSDKLGRGAGSFESILKKTFEDERAVLFIPKLGKVRIVLPNEQWELNRNGNGWCQRTYEKDVSDEMRDRIDSQLDTDKENCRIPPKYRGMQKTSVSFACKLSGKRLVPEKDSILYCYLPARKSSWGFKFLMNTDMIPNGARSDIEYSIPLNKEFTRIAGEKFFEWIDSLIRSGQYEYDSIFALIPDFEECIKNRNEKVIEFIKEFQGGFEEKLPQLQIPSSNKRLVSVSSIIHDTTGILAEMGESVWGHLGIELEIVDSSLRDSIPFAAFCKAYKERLGIKEFGVDDLLAKTSSDQFQRWLSNPMANKKFIEFLISKNELARFKEAKIFLDDKGNLGCPQEMYFHPDVEKYLKDFSWCFRYLPSSAPCRDKVDKDWFMPLAPKKLVCDILFSQDNENHVREQLSRVNTSRLFWGFLARYKTYTRVIEERYYSNYYRRSQTRRVSKQENRFSQGFLAKLPVVLDNGETARAIVENNKSVFIAEQNQTHPAVSDYQWTESGWVGFIADGYFDWEEGSKVRDFFLEKRKGGNGEWQLVHNWNLLGIWVAIADKFKGNIRPESVKVAPTLARWRSHHGFRIITWQENGLHCQRIKQVVLKIHPFCSWTMKVWQKGLNGVYIAQRDDAVVTLVESGALSRDIKVLDSRLCESEEMLKYWEWLGCKMLDSDRLMDEKIRRYLLIQSSETNVDEFRSIHKGFIREVIVAGGLEAKLKGVLLYDEHGKLVNPDMLVLGARYNPACDFQGHGVSHHYVSEVYLDLIDDHDKVKSFLLGLGVREDFTKDDVGCFSEISFCKYFWHDYVKKSEAVREKFHEWITPDSKCVLDGLGNIRAPKELYDIELADYVNALQNRDAKLPDVDMLAGLGFRQELSIMDCLDYLLTNPPAKMRGRVLVWLA